MNAAERRHFQRILLDLPATIEGPDGASPTQVIDISLKGALVRCPEGWNSPPGSQVTLVLRLDRGDNKIRMEGQIAHQEEGVLGITRHHIDIHSISHLKRLLELHLDDSELLQRELQALG